MEYSRKVDKMLDHLRDHNTPEMLSYLTRSLAFGIAQASVNLKSIKAQQKLIDAVCEAMKKEALELYRDQKPITNEEFLTYFYTPVKFNG